MENKRKHLEFIQTTIGRLAENSFLLKGWAITIVAGIFALSPSDHAWKLIVVADSLVLIFWLLDSYYLRQERLFRALYNHVRKFRGKAIDFNMDTKVLPKQENCSWIKVGLSQTLRAFYVPLIVITIVIFYLK